MKLFTLWRFILLSALFSLLGIGSAWAQLRDGGVYYFESAYLTGKSITTANATKLTSVTTDKSDTKQLWVANEVSTGSGEFTLRNLANKQYLRSTNSDLGSSYWHTAETADANCQFSCTGPDGSGTYAMRATNTDHERHFMHAPSADKVVGWADGSAASRWLINEVNLYDADAVPEALDNLFEDAACTTLEKTFDNIKDIDIDIDYLTLPEALRNMVKKVYSQTWTENNYDGSKLAWDSEYAQKYRVQLYEPYNDIMNASKALNINWHTNLNNPTGIFANNGDVLYIMVEGEIKEGASLYLDYFVDGERLSTDLNHGTPLQPGLNIITCTADKSNYCINYVVETFDISGDKRGHVAKKRSLSGYKPLKIHIEGGYINGYWNKMGDELYPADDKDDWNYLEARANQKEVLILGQYMTLQFPLKDEDTEGNTGLATYLNDEVYVEDVIREWDNIMMWERLLLGVLGEEALNAASPKSPYSESDHVIEYTGNDSDFPSGYGDYYNIHGLAWGVNHNFMYATGDMSAYHYNTMGGIFQEMPTSAGSHWGPAHEIGHQHQNLINMRGEMEVSNNLFSNVVLWLYGSTTSRVNGSEGSLDAVLQNFNNASGHYLTNSVWGMTQMYYKLFLYYHVLGHNPKFYPRLFEMLRQDPQKDNNATVVDGAKAQLHLYKKVCQAAGEDLTEFFRAHGFFKPLDGWSIDDYGVSTYYMTQAQIDAAIAEVKAQAKSNDWKENTAVLFINDATGESILSHRDDVESLELYGETTICAEVGGYSNFDNNATNYTYTISGNTVTMEGEGGVGFAVFNEKGEIVAFSNNKTFELSVEAAAVIASGKGSIVTINGNSTTTPTTNVMESADAETQHNLLGQLLADVQTLIELEDATGKKVGFYKSACVADLKTLYDEAKAVYDAQNEASYAAVYSALYQESVNLQNNDFARNGIVQGNSYRLTNKNYPTRTMGVGAENVMYGLESFDDARADLWYIEKAEGQNKYYLKNKLTELYAGDVQSGMVPDKDLAGAYAYQLREMGPGVYAFQGSNGLHCSTWNEGYKIVGWGADSPATQWYITAVDINEAGINLSELETVIAQTEELVNEMANVMMKGTLDLSTCTITSNATETGHETKYLIDRNTSTFFHTVWSGTAVQAHHNIIVDLGEGNSLEQFVLNYTTLPSSAHNVDAPTAIVIKGSSDGDSYEDITTINSGLPVEKDATYISDVLGTVGTGYRYIRFDVTDATGGYLGNYKYFGIAELGLTNMQTKVLSVNPSYSASELLIVKVCEVLDAGISVCSNKSATADELQDATAILTEKYNELLQAYNDVKNAPLIAKKEELQTLIERTQALIAECGEVNRIPEAEESISLSADAGTYPYLSCPNLYNPNKLMTNGGDNDYNCAHLLDGDIQTYIHTDHKADAATYPHYLQVDFGTTDAAPDYFKFTYDTRYENGDQAPKKIVVKGSNNGEDFEELGTYSSADATNALPTNAQTRWKVDAPITSGYRYVRFYVTESAKGTTTPYFVMAEFGVSKITPSFYSAVLKNNVGEVTEELLLTTYFENQSAQATFDFANNEAQLDKAIANLEAQYTALQTAKNNVAKSELLSAIEAAQDAIALCCSSITQENGDYSVTWIFETAGDVDKATLIAAYEAVVNANSVYESASSTVDDYQTALTTLSAPISTLNEYMEGDHKPQLRYMVGVITAFITDCQESLGDLTNGMFEDIVQKRDAANGYLTLEFATHEELVNTIATAISYFEQNYPSWLTAQQSSAKAELRSLIAQLTELIEQCGVVEFVPATEGNEAHYVATLDPYAGVVTAEQLIAAYKANVDANTFADNSAVADDLTAKKSVLQEVYNNLLTAKDTNWLPVTLTKDITTPVLYTFKSARGANKVMQYDPADAHSFSITDAVANAAKQAFFFMLGTKREQVYIYPYAAAGMVLGADNTGDGANKVFAGEKGTQAYEQWTFVKRTVEDVIWYDLKPVGEETYFSNFGGGSNKMGFYNSSDEGSRFQFDEVEVEIEGSAAYNSLKVYHEDLAKVKGSTLVGSTEVGYYPEDQATVYNTAYAAATETLADANATDDDYLAEYASLRSANEAMAMNMPEDGGYYIIQSVVKDNGTALVYANPTDNKMYWSNSKTATSPEALWMFEDNGDGTYTVSNMHTGTMMNGFINYNPTPLNPETGSVTLHSLASNGQIGIKTGNTMMHAQSGGAIVHWDTGANDGSAWRIIKADETAITYPLNITQYGYAGLHLNYPVELPNELTAYTIYLAEGANGIARLKPINGSVVPANTGVIIEGKQGDYNLNYTTNEGNKIDNLLLGSNYTRYVKADNNTDYFVFAAKKQADDSYKVGLYITWEQYDANGSTDVKDSEGQVVGSNKNTHQGGYFKSSANKIYLPYSNEAGAAKFFFQRDYDITGIDSLLNGLNSCDEVYDLQGRRISKVTKEGIYIVNGQKRYLKATKF